jgi:hypothetical protein
MIRTFDWRDVGLVRTLGERGVCLDSATGLTRGVQPLQNALMEYLMPGVGTPTLVGRPEGKNGGEGAVFGQLQHRPRHEQAHVLFIAPQYTPTVTHNWLALVEDLAEQAGQRGAHNLIAEVNGDSAEFEALRSAGFAIYARQSLWKLGAGGDFPAPPRDVPLRPAKNIDAIGVHTLYSNIVPRLVQQVEHLPRNISRGYVLEQGSETIAFLDVKRGPLGIWMEPYLHPEAYDLSEAVLHTCLDLLPNHSTKPVYVCVRRYQDWLQEIVARAGFEFMGSQAVMVKRLAVRVTEPLLKPLTVAEGQVPTPLVRAQLGARDEPHTRGTYLTSRTRPDGLSDHAKTNHRRSPRPDGRHPSQHWGGPQRCESH